VIDHLAFGRPAAERARRGRARRARRRWPTTPARALDKTLLAHGAPARPVREQTIRWYKRKPAT
jgi:indolepyruvate ferredoxin oxidoreductase beta subunit